MGAASIHIPVDTEVFCSNIIVISFLQLIVISRSLGLGDLKMAADEIWVLHGGAPRPADTLDAEEGFHEEAQEDLGEQKVIRDGGHAEAAGWSDGAYRGTS